jgi:hypothetical protein
MQQAGLRVARLEVIRRQRDPNLRQAVTLAAEGRIADALTLLENQHRVREIAAAKERYEAIGEEYLSAHEAGERVLVVSPVNDERRQLNSAIRALLKSRGHVAAEGKDILDNSVGLVHTWTHGTPDPSTSNCLLRQSRQLSPLHRSSPVA